MNKGLKVGLGAVAVAGLAYVGGAVWTGQLVKKQYEVQSAKLATQLPFLKVVANEHQAGVFSSTHTTTFQLGCVPTDADGKPGEPLQLTLRDRVSHGPLPGFKQVGAALIESELVLPEAAKAKLTQVFGDQAPLTVRTLVNFNKTYASTLSSPPAELAAGEGQQLSWGGVQAQFSGDLSGETVKYDVSLPKFEVFNAKQGASIKMTGLAYRGDGRSEGGSLWAMSGKAEGEMELFEMSVRPPQAAGSDPFRLALNQLKFTGSSTIDQQLLSSTSTVAGRGQVGDTKLDRLEMSASFKRVHVPSYLSLVSTVMDGAFSCKGGPAPDPQALTQAMQASLVKMLQHNPEYSLDKLAVEMGGKRGELSYGLSMQGVTEADLQMPLPMLMMSKGQLKMDAKLPVAWISQVMSSVNAQAAAPQPEMVDVMLEQFASQGFIVRDGDYVSSKLRFASGQVEVNGKPMPLGRPAQQQ